MSAVATTYHELDHATLVGEALRLRDDLAAASAALERQSQLIAELEAALQASRRQVQRLEADIVRAAARQERADTLLARAVSPG